MTEKFEFPAIEKALSEPNGLLAIGGSLDQATLLDAYSRGIFPWYDKRQPILWWSPDPRAVLRPADFRASTRLRRTMRSKCWELSVNTCFEAVVENCAAARADSDGTWITEAMKAAYLALHRAGHAHSIEVWEVSAAGRELVGGLYGVATGEIFSGESMFHRVTDASKVALAATCKHVEHIGWQLVDCQIPNSHLTSLGATLLPRAEFAHLLREGIGRHGSFAPTMALWESLAWKNSGELERSFQ